MTTELHLSLCHNCQVKLLYDLRCHPTTTLLYPGMASFHGPALCAFNNSVFSDEDFISIKRIGDSTKLAAKGKVGRFGVGFNSVCERCMGKCDAGVSDYP